MGDPWKNVLTEWIARTSMEKRQSSIVEVDPRRRMKTGKVVERLLIYVSSRPFDCDFRMWRKTARVPGCDSVIMISHKRRVGTHLSEFFDDLIWLRTIPNQIAEEKELVICRQVSDDCEKGIKVGVHVRNYRDSQGQDRQYYR